MRAPVKRHDSLRREQETIIRFDGERDEVALFTAYPAMRRKIERRGWRPVKVARKAGKEVGWFYRVPYGMLRWGLRAESRPLPRGIGT